MGTNELASRCATLPEGRRLLAEAAEETALLLCGRVFLVGMVLIAPLIRGNLLLHRVNVLAAALPGGLSAYLAGGGSTHDCLLRCCAANTSLDPRHRVATVRPQSGRAVASGQSEEQLPELFGRDGPGCD